MRESTVESRPLTAASAPARRSRLGLLLDPGTARGQGRPLLDPASWTPRHRYFVLAGLALAVLAGLVKSVQAGPLIGGVSGIRAFLAAAFAVALVGLAVSLRGLTLPGVVVGGVFVVAGMLSWAYTDTPIVVWAVLAFEGVLFAIWTFPWVRELVHLPKLGAAWLGLAYWYLGIVGALLVWHPNVTAQRIAYAGVFTLGAIAVVVATRKSGQDLSVGIVAAFLVALALLYFAGSGNALSSLHPVPANGWGAHMQYRFWGATGLLYHPNSIAIVAVMICLRIGADRAFERWQRYAALAVTTVTLLLVNSRTGLAYLGLAAGVHALLLLRQQWVLRRGGTPSDDGLERYPDVRAAVAAALLPLLAVAVIAIGSGGTAFLTANRYSSSGDDQDITSGRTATWSAVFKEFKADSLPEKLLGDAKYARAIVTRPGSSVKLTTDNSAVGALRRGGVLGELAYLFGLGLLLWHGIRGVAGRRPPAWLTLATVGSLASIPFADWLLGGTGGTLWIYLLAGEAALLFTPGRRE
ncbi:MAG TPA: O-antigen ligase family protein [Rugosimonospora sp.]|nr:O-antigen ligase family protein [Rugosimonospora sp.]